MLSAGLKGDTVWWSDRDGEVSGLGGLQAMMGLWACEPQAAVCWDMKAICPREGEARVRLWLLLVGRSIWWSGEPSSMRGWKRGWGGACA